MLPFRTQSTPPLLHLQPARILRRIRVTSVAEHEDEGGEGEELKEEDEGVETTQFAFCNSGVETGGGRAVVTVAVMEDLRGSHGG
ncbi:hypothetical protein QN277_010157 [Acacia crassicarpa]|uniref:Uncharacterized protein n=1 Tax=Acacia crassicarpa TaxID=499986 RepID=A0AAE1M8L7_9FABA|nr:hypothetical protein QN277_010157 [Acacia crassicarpa]